MAEVLGVAASVVGIILPALHGARLLLDDIHSIQDAPKAVKRLEEDVRSMEMALISLQTLEDGEWEALGTAIADQAKITIDSCTQACEQFRLKLQQWTRHSDAKLVWQDRAVLGFFRQGQLKAMSEQLQNYKLSLISIVNIATLCSSIRHTHMTEDAQKMIATRQTEIKDAIATTDKNLVVLESKLEDLKPGEADEPETTAAVAATATAASGDTQAETLRQLEEERKALDASRELLAQLLSKSQETVDAMTAVKNVRYVKNITFGAGNSGFQAGVIHGPVSGFSWGGQGS